MFFLSSGYKKYVLVLSVAKFLEFGEWWCERENKVEWKKGRNNKGRNNKGELKKG